MILRLLCDENGSASLVAALRMAGHDVVAVSEQASGSPDLEVLGWAQRDGRICVTFDNDFGELAVRLRTAADYGIILIRLAAGPGSRGLAEIVTRIGERDDWAGHLASLEPRRTRLRRLRG